MSSFLYGLGHACFRLRRRVLVGWLAALVVLVGLGGATMGKFSDQFDIPGAPAAEALTQLRQTFPEVAGVRATVLVIAPPGDTVDNPQVRRGIERGIDVLTQNSNLVDNATSPFDEFIKGMVNPDRSAAMINVSLKRTDASEITDAEREHLQEQAAEIQQLMPPGSTVAMGGEAFSIEVPKLSAVEAVGVGLALIVLILTFGSVVAGFVPIATALIGVLVSMAPMLFATRFTTLSSTTPMLALMLGLAVGIDYALFIISRHRDQLGRGMPVEESAARSVATAGSAVVFAGLTVVIALVGLTLSGIPFLGAMGIFAAITVAFQVLVALTLVPAFLGFLGERLRPRHARGEIDREALAARQQRGIWARWVRLVTRAPIVTIVLVLVALGALSVPAKDMRLSLPNSGQHAATAPDRITYDLIEQKFGPGYNGPLIVTADIIQSTDPLGLVDDLKREIEQLPGVASVPVATPNPNADTAFIQVIPTGGPTDESTKQLVQTLRDNQDQWQQRYGTETAVTGITAIQIDITDRLAAALLPFGIFVVGFSLILLTMVFRSIAVPIKATIGYLLSVGVAFGATAMVFSYGWGKDLINLEKPMPVISFYPILLMGILFGLAMDYEVFLVSRMREDYVHGDPRNPNRARHAIETGFIGSAKVVTAAAVIMFAVFAFFVPNGEGPIKPIAFGLAVGVAVDAFIVRMTLVPAVLALLGDRAWWLPRWLDRRLPSFDVEGEALEHMLALRDWPHPGSTDVVRTEGYGVRDHHGPIAAPADLHLAPGQVLVLEGEPEVRTPTLFGLAGRVRAVDGRIKVAGLVLPEQAGRVRRKVAFVEGRHGTVRNDLTTALRDRQVDLIIVDGADAVGDHDERAAIASLIEEVGDGQRRPGVILGVADIDVVADLAPRGFDAFTLAPPAAAEPAELVPSNGKQEL
ncbi:transporter [Enemella evansiae]|uniref:MMPL family transporter n=1 Tax=Enemella evansiae TaxID=2016499 RepID=UPI000B9672D1|nr:MMPL family transporter [Enemella evansiae]OYO00705.1 transporter [Enemella evansiae]